MNNYFNYFILMTKEKMNENKCIFDSVICKVMKIKSTVSILRTENEINKHWSEINRYNIWTNVQCISETVVRREGAFSIFTSTNFDTWYISLMFIRYYFSISLVLFILEELMANWSINKRPVKLHTAVNWTDIMYKACHIQLFKSAN